MAQAVITWLGHAAVRLETGSGLVILVDPWVANPKAPADVSTFVEKVDLILVTHGHADHVGQTLEIAHRTGATVVCTYDLMTALTLQDMERIEPMNHGGTIEVSGIGITMTEARHGSSHTLPDGRVFPDTASGYVIRLEDGRRIYHAGDTCLFEDMKLIRERGRLDVAILPIGGRFTMDPPDAAKAATWLNPVLLIPVHFGTFPMLTGTPEAFREALPAAMKPRLRVLQPGQSLEM